MCNLFQIPNAPAGKSWGHAIAFGYALGIALKAVKSGYFLVFASQIALIVGCAHIAIVGDAGKHYGYGIVVHFATTDASAQLFELSHIVGIERLCG